MPRINHLLAGLALAATVVGLEIWLGFDGLGLLLGASMMLAAMAMRRSRRSLPQD